MNVSRRLSLEAKRRSVTVGLATATLLAVCSIFAAPFASTAEEPMFDARSRQRLSEMATFLAKAGSLSVDVSSRYDEIEGAGIKIKRATESKIILRRPDKLYFKTERDDGAVAEGWFDGSKLLIAPEGKQLYAEIPVAGSIDDMLDHLADNYLMHVPAADLLYNDLKAVLQAGLISGRQIGQRSLNGRSLDHLSFESECCDWQVWIDQGDQPLPRQLVVSFLSIEHEPEQITLLEDWRIDEKVDDSTFSFSPPSSWKEFELARRPTPPGS